MQNDSLFDRGNALKDDDDQDKVIGKLIETPKRNGLQNSCLKYKVF